MTIAVLQEPIFTDEIKAREWLEGRVWAGWSGLPALRLGPRARDQARRLEASSGPIPGFRSLNRVTLGVKDERRAAKLADDGIVGKRLTYRRPHSQSHTTQN